MNITNHTVTARTCNALERLPDDCRAQMANVERLRNIWASIIDQNRFPLPELRYPHTGILRYFCRIGSKPFLSRRQVEKTGARRLCL